MYSRKFQRILYETMAIIFFVTLAGYATAQVKEYPEKQIEIIIGFSLEVRSMCQPEFSPKNSKKS